MTAGRCNRGGFTLIEALMVVTLIAMVAAFAIPKIDFTRYRVNSAVRGLAGLLNRAQRMAVTDQNNVNVIFDLTNASVALHEDANNNNAIDNGERVRSYPLGEGAAFGLGGATARSYTPAPITFTRRINGKPELIFRRDGSASESGAIYVTSIRATANDNPADTRSVEPVRATGRVEWYQYNGTQWIRRF
jgi:prepilin-type N-terminal cleavage/methylation domain-containing protein